MNFVKQPRRRHAEVLSAIIVASVGSGLPTQSFASSTAFDGLVAAERAFSRDAGRIGINPAFRAHAATDAVLIQPDPMPAAALIAGAANGPETSLEWQPGFAGLARSSDLGFTTGPYRLRSNGNVQRGQYLTIWQRTDKGAWKWYLDHGSFPVVGDLTEPFPTRVSRMKNGVVVNGAAGAKADQADSAFNLALVRTGPSALMSVLASDALVLRPGQSPMRGRDATAAATKSLSFTAAEQIGVRQSHAGDLAVTYGRLATGAESRVAYYVRVWRRDPRGWRVVVDELTWRRM